MSENEIGISKVGIQMVFQADFLTFWIGLKPPARIEIYASF